MLVIYYGFAELWPFGQTFFSLWHNLPLVTILWHSLHFGFSSKLRVHRHISVYQGGDENQGKCKQRGEKNSASYDTHSFLTTSLGFVYTLY